MLSEHEIDLILQDIYKGRLNPLNLPKDLYLAVGNHLEKALYKGYGGTIKQFDFNSIDFEFLSELRENVYLFSAAKTFNYTLATSNLIVDEDGDILPLKEFKKRAREIHEKYNDHWLEAEHTTAQLQAESGARWNRIQSEKRLFPYLRYETVGDLNVSPVCNSLEGIIKKVDDPFWKTHAPLNHYNCRCILEQIDYLEEVKETDLRTRKVISPVPAFQNNVGTSREVFTKDHPYFDVPKKYKAFAKRNFDLDIPEVD